MAFQDHWVQKSERPAATWTSSALPPKSSAKKKAKQSAWNILASSRQKTPLHTQKLSSHLRGLSPHA